MRALIILVLLLAVIPVQAGEHRTVTCKGRIGVGSTDSGIHGLASDCGWLTGSRIESQILSKCDVLDDCEIVGQVDEMDLFINVLSVKRIKTAAEPPVNLLKEAACKAAMPWVDDCNISLNSIFLEVVSLNTVARRRFTSWNYVANVMYKETSRNTHVFTDVKFSAIRRNGKWYIP